MVAPIALASAALLLGACSSEKHQASAATSSSVTATSAPTAASTFTSSPPAVNATAACYIGDWVSTDYSQKVQGQSISGGAGIHFMITAGQISVDFTGMAPVAISGGAVSGQGIYAGQEQAPVSFAPSGTLMLPTAGTGDVTFQSKLAASTSYSPPIKASGFPAGGITGTWACAGSKLSISVPTPYGPTTVNMSRQ
jgi:hypothetical protein